jgi:hypothetical protein
MLAEDGPWNSLHYLGLSCRDKERSLNHFRMFVIDDPARSLPLEARDIRPALWTAPEFGCVSFEQSEDG